MPGNEYHFGSANSNRIRTGTQYARTSGAFMPYAGLACKYGFDGREDGQVFAYLMKDIDPGGSAVVAGLDMSWFLTADDHLRLNVALPGFPGNREGVMESFRLNYLFWFSGLSG